MTATDPNEHDEAPPATERPGTALLHGDSDRGRVEYRGRTGVPQWLGALFAEKKRENGERNTPRGHPRGRSAPSRP